MDIPFPFVRSLAKKLARKFGIELSRYAPGSSPAAALGALLGFNNIDLVLDVGANTGQFARHIRAAGYAGKIVSFEPLSDAYVELQRSSEADSLWTVAPRMAIGNHDGEAHINIARNSASSSILPMLPSHLKAAPASRYIGTEKVRLARLDTVCPRYMGGCQSPFLKIDVQGYESQVLDGGNETLAAVKGLQLELSLVPLYDGQALFLELVERLGHEEFALHGVVPGLTDPGSGRLLQFDGIFFR